MREAILDIFMTVIDIIKHTAERSNLTILIQLGDFTRWAKSNTNANMVV